MDSKKLNQVKIYCHKIIHNFELLKLHKRGTMALQDNMNIDIIELQWHKNHTDLELSLIDPVINTLQQSPNGLA